MSDVTTVGDLLEELKGLDPTQPLKVSCSLESGRSVSGDGDCDFRVEEEEGVVHLHVSGDCDSDTGWWE